MSRGIEHLNQYTFPRLIKRGSIGMSFMAPLQRCAEANGTV